MRKNICKYFERCPVTKIIGRDCADSDNCRTKRFYNQYGLDYLSLGVGAMMIPVGLEAEVDSQKSRKA